MSRSPNTDQMNVSVLPLAGNGDAFVFAHASFNQRHGQLSPDGRWMAYVSDESGQNEVFVRPFPHGESKSQVSRGGGTEPKWRGDGQELFYVAPDSTLRSVAVRTTRGFEIGQPRTLFKSKVLSPRTTGVTGRNQYDVTPDGQRFLVVQAVEDSASSLAVVLNWPALLRQ
jgi:hypothetical protein